VVDRVVEEAAKKYGITDEEKIEEAFWIVMKLRHYQGKRWQGLGPIICTKIGRRTVVVGYTNLEGMKAIARCVCEQIKKGKEFLFNNEGFVGNLGIEKSKWSKYITMIE
jgi:hypothetical protein